MCDRDVVVLTVPEEKTGHVPCTGPHPRSICNLCNTKSRVRTGSYE